MPLFKSDKEKLLAEGEKPVWDLKVKKAIMGLIDKGVDPNVTGPGGYTMLHYAAKSDAHSMIDYLIRKGYESELVWSYVQKL